MPLVYIERVGSDLQQTFGYFRHSRSNRRQHCRGLRGQLGGGQTGAEGRGRQVQKGRQTDAERRADRCRRGVIV